MLKPRNLCESRSDGKSKEVAEANVKTDKSPSVTNLVHELSAECKMDPDVKVTKDSP